MMIYLVALASILVGGSEAVIFNVTQTNSMITYNVDFITGDICVSANSMIDDPCDDPMGARIVVSGLREVRLRHRRVGRRHGNGKRKWRMTRNFIDSCPRSDSFNHSMNGFGNNSLGDPQFGTVDFPVTDDNGTETTVLAVNLNITWFLDRQGQAPGAKVELFLYFFLGSGTINFLGEIAQVNSGTVKWSFKVMGWKFCRKCRRRRWPHGSCGGERRQPRINRRCRTFLEMTIRIVNMGPDPLLTQCSNEEVTTPPGCSLTQSSSLAPQFHFNYFMSVLTDGNKDCMPHFYPLVSDCLNPDPVSFRRRFRKPVNVNNLTCSTASVTLALPQFENTSFVDPCFCAFCAGMIPSLGLSLLPVIFINLFYLLS